MKQPGEETAVIFLAKAEESLAGAESEYANGRYNNCAARCYYACFQAAIAALLHAGQPAQRNGQNAFRHAFVQAQFVEQLIQRHKQYPATSRDVLARTLVLRQMADYEVEQISQTQASRALQRTRTFVTAVRERGGEN